MIPYQAPYGAELNFDFEGKVRNPGEGWKDLPVYLVKGDKSENDKYHTREAYMAYFDFRGDIEVKVVYKKGDIENARIRPLSYSIDTKKQKNSFFLQTFLAQKFVC